VEAVEAVEAVEEVLEDQVQELNNKSVSKNIVLKV
jgi:hypothetical protein